MKVTIVKAEINFDSIMLTVEGDEINAIFSVPAGMTREETLNEARKVIEGMGIARKSMEKASAIVDSLVGEVLEV